MHYHIVPSYCSGHSSPLLRFFLLRFAPAFPLPVPTAPAPVLSLAFAVLAEASFPPVASAARVPDGPAAAPCPELTRSRSFPFRLASPGRGGCGVKSSLH